MKAEIYILVLYVEFETCSEAWIKAAWNSLFEPKENQEDA